MKKFILPIICSSVLLLSSCGETKSSDSLNTPNTSTSTGVNQIIASGSRTNAGSTAPLSKDTRAIIDLQMKSPDVILKLDCNTYDAEGKAYCTTEKTKMETHMNEVTWQKVLAKGDEYIKTFDCSTITSTFGKKYCSEYQAKIVKSPPVTSSGVSVTK